MDANKYPTAIEPAEGAFPARKKIEPREYKGAWLRMEKGLYAAYLHGSEKEMGRQHAELFREEILESAFQYYPKMLEYQLGHSLPPKAARLLAAAADRIAAKRVTGKLDAEDRAAYEGIAEAMGMDADELLRNNIIPDLLQCGIGLLYRSRLTTSLPQPLLGCTSFVAKDSATADGHVLMGHNKDYPGMGYFDRYPTVFFCEPDKGRRYVMFASAGIHTPSLNSINECGVAFVCHTLLTSDVTINGLPLFSSGRQIMEKAETVKDAVSILSGMRFMAGWNFLVADAKGDAASVETTAGGNSVSFMRGDYSQFSNIYKRARGQKRELSISPSVRANFENRYVRMGELLEKNKGKISPALGAAMMGDNYDIFTGSKRMAGGIIAQVQNVMSLVFDLSDMRFWVADGWAPSCYGVYRGFGFEDGFKGKFSDVSDYPGNKVGRRRYEGVRYYIQAEHAIMIRRDYQTAADLMEKAVALEDKEFLYPAIGGVVNLYAGRIERGERLLEEALKLPDIPSRTGMAKLWLGRALDMLGRRDEAKKMYAEVSADEALDKPLRNAGLKGLRRAFVKPNLSCFPIDFWMGDSMEY